MSKARSSGQIRLLVVWIPSRLGRFAVQRDRRTFVEFQRVSRSTGLVARFELEHNVVATGTQTEGMKNQFIGSKAAMIVDGPWNWATYEASRLDVGQAMLPIIDATGERVAPLVTYKGWTVSKQSTHKLASVDLALYLQAKTSSSLHWRRTPCRPTSSWARTTKSVMMRSFPDSWTS